MSNVRLTIAGFSFSLACAPGEEEHVENLGRMIDEKVRQVPGARSQGESRMLLFAALMLADELHEAKKMPPASDAPAVPAEPEAIVTPEPAVVAEAEPEVASEAEPDAVAEAEAEVAEGTELEVAEIAALEAEPMADAAEAPPPSAADASPVSSLSEMEELVLATLPDTLEYLAERLEKIAEQLEQ